MPKNDNIRDEGPPDPDSVLYRVRNSQIPNALALPLVLGLIGLVGTVLVTFYNSRDSLSAELRGTIDRSEAKLTRRIERVEDNAAKDLLDLKVATKENRNQIIILWQRVGDGK